MTPPAVTGSAAAGTRQIMFCCSQCFKTGIKKRQETPHVPENTVTLDISADEYGGIKNLDFGGEKISVICREYDPENGKCVIETEAEKEFTLKIKTDFSQSESTITVEKGKHFYKLFW